MLPVEHEEPAGQTVHSLAVTRSVAFEKVFAGQGRVAAAPGGQYEPGTHAWHSVERMLSLSLPAGHVKQPVPPSSGL